MPQCLPPILREGPWKYSTSVKILKNRGKYGSENGSLTPSTFSILLIFLPGGASV